MKPALLDTSAIVAMLDVSQESRASHGGPPFLEGRIGDGRTGHCQELPSASSSPWSTGSHHQNVARNIFEIPFHLAGAAADIESLFRKYRDQPISLADACLIHLAGELGTGDIFTLDHDFEVYRWGRNRAFRLLVPLG